MTVYSQSPLRFGSVSAVTATRGPNDPEVGTVIREGDEEYIYVYNNSADGQILPGHLAVCTAVTGYSVNVTSTTMVDVPVGVCKHATITTGSYGWLLRSGFGPARAGTVVIAAGDLLTVGAAGVWVPRLNSTAYSQTILPAVYGKCMTSAACASTGDAYFNIG